jgi:DNA-binding response OmpR family regulator
LHDKILVFKLGIQDYLEKPIDYQELRVRIEARLRSLDRKNTWISKGQVHVNPNSHEVIVEDGGGAKQRVDLTPLEFKILWLFFENENRILNRNQIISGAWGMNAYVTDRSVDIHVSGLRKKIKNCSECLFL